VTYDTADYRSGRGSKNAATAEDVTRDTAYAGADSGALVLPRHPGTTAQADQKCCRNCAN
jgi:hypothetical protein